MKIRSTIILMAVPLFLVLALVNGALLYFQERAEMERALNDQALAAAVTIAEFAAEMDDPRAELSQPVRTQALRSALGRVKGLGDVVWIGANRPPLTLTERETDWDVTSFEKPEKPTSLGIAGEPGERWMTAIAPAGSGRFVAARLTAEPVFARMDEIKLNVMLIVLAAGIFAALLGWFVAHRITRELAVNKRMLTGDTAASSDSELRIREAQDLADAVRLMEASRDAADARSQLVMSRRDKDRTVLGAIEETRAEIFAPMAVRDGNTEVALRICGDAPAGSFFAHAASAQTVVLGRCKADNPLDALADAVEIRRLLESSGNSDELEKTLKLVRAAFDVEVLEIRSYSAGTQEPKGLQLLSVAEPESASAAERYCENNPGVVPQALLSGLAILLEPTGVFAALRKGVSADRGNSPVNVAFDREEA